ARRRRRARLRRGAPRRARPDQGGAGGARVTFRVRPVNRLHGTVEVPGDKSISHRAALLGALADGVTEIHGYLEAEDCVRTLTAIAHTAPVASAQVKSAVLLAGLYADGPVTVHEPASSRDHSERMLRQFGARLRVEGGGVTLEPGDLYGTTVCVPGDISSAAFLLVAAAIVRDARVSVTRVGVNPTRTGILTVLEAMGARVEVVEAGEDAEPLASLTLGGAELRAARVGGPLVPRLIDELPALAVAAVVARGATTVSDAAELRV